ncbi:acyltransferase family protein [Blastococcus saxobsidens]|uniref:Peptidoglycan/LPS O-acetylase OafA/YrhL n=1 Tax=Blastococcus saxobsidens TaxID=138336 RepID=A0A4Q7YE32_9ACTN|nr:acyltransferase [Blastococcus saxobsidens]RZU34459.1 peptidoglycan/LPS O-acetylase OafA/YrhL [Blastococcus saxobsidens]
MTGTVAVVRSAVPGDDRQFLPALDGLRAVAALLVVGYHAALTTWPLDVGWAGVAIFFVLSGYLITRLSLADEAGRGFSFRGFWIRRVARIVPLYLLAVAAFMVLPFVGEGGGWSTVARTLPYYLTFNGEFVEDGPMSVAWSLGIEEKFYLLWPIVAFALFAGRRGRLPATGTAAVLCLVTAVLLPVPGLSGYAGLLVGAALAFLERRCGWVADGLPGALARPVAGWLSTLAVAGVLVAANVPADDSVVYLLLCPLVAVLLLHLVHGRSAVTRFLGTAPMRWLGRRSYGIYLLHTLALTVCAKALPAGLPARDLWVGAGCLALTLVVSDVAHRLVERPFIRLGREWSRSAEADRAPGVGARVELGRVPGSRASRRHQG